MKIFICSRQVYSQPIKFILLILSKNKSFPVEFLQSKQGASIIFDHDDPDSAYIHTNFYRNVCEKGIFDFEYHFTSGPYISDGDKIDYLATAFYMINSLQELTGKQDVYDQFGRFKYTSSYQAYFNCLHKNSVQQCFDSFCSAIKELNKYTTYKKSTRVFLSHDIDNINGALLQDGFWALKHGRLDVIFKLIANTLLLKPDWQNIDKIIKIHDEHDLKSTFFWLASRSTGANTIKNADYAIGQVKKDVLKASSNGLHKSSDDLSFEQEIERLPFKAESNRYHFLNFRLPDAWKEIEASSIKLDASLGFAENYGFRNNYGLPFCPYNFETQSAYDFVEVPLHIMDRTFQQYLKIPRANTADAIIGFMEQHKYNCLISILWHNTHFTQYKYGGYLQEYKKLLLYIFENKIESVSPG